MRRPEPEPTLLTGAPFRLADAAAVDVSRSRLRSSLWRPLGRDLFVAADTPDTPELFLAAARLVLPTGAAVSRLSAAALHGIDIGPSTLEPVDVTTPTLWTPRQQPIVRAHRAPLPDEDVIEVNGVPVTSALRTAYDLARGRDLVEAVVAVDAFWHAGLVLPDELLAFAAERGWPDGGRLRRAVQLADRGADSPMESRLRLVLVIDAGLPRPQTQLEVPDGFGGTLARLDLGYVDFKVGAEHNGRVHDDHQVQIRDYRRHNRLKAAGWTVFVYGGDDYYKRRHVIVRELTEELRRAGAKV